MYQLPKFTSLFLLLCLLISCGETLRKAPEKPRISLSESQIDSVMEEIDFTYLTPIEADSSAYLIFPLSAYAKTSSRSDLIPSLKSSYSENYSGYWNLLFFHSGTLSSHLLTESQILISDYKISIPDAGPILSRSILLTVRDTDFNEDGKLNLGDPQSLYLAQQDGKNFLRISPENEHLISYKVLFEKDEIVYQTQGISLDEGKVLYDDSSSWYYINLSKGNKSNRILDFEQEKEIERLFFDQWVSPQIE